MADDMQATGSLKERLRAGATLIGTFVQTPHPVVCEFLGGTAGIDLLCLEAEHSAMDAPTMQHMIAAGEGVGMPTLVRVENSEWVPIARALDAGAAGVIAPRVNSGAETRALVKAALYPPAGDRGIGPGRVTGYGTNSGPDFRIAANEGVLVAAQVETRAALERLDEILEVEGLDLVFVGPMDLASSLDLAPGSIELERVIEEIVARTRYAGRFAGIFAGTAEQTAFWVDRDVRLILLASDLMFMARGMADALRTLSESTARRDAKADSGATAAGSTRAGGEHRERRT